MSQWEIRSDLGRVALTNEQLQDALAYYDVPLLRLERQTEWAFRSIQRFMRGSKKHDYPWFMDWVLLGYELDEELRHVASGLTAEDGYLIHPGTLPIPAEWGDREDRGYLSHRQLGRILNLYAVAPEMFAEHLGRKPIAIQDYIEGKKEFIPPWMEWLLLMYHRHPEVRTMRGRPALPLDKWKGAAAPKSGALDEDKSSR